jgi:hypothetical protein
MLTAKRAQEVLEFRRSRLAIQAVVKFATTFVAASLRFRGAGQCGRPVAAGQMGQGEIELDQTDRRGIGSRGGVSSATEVRDRIIVPAIMPRLMSAEVSPESSSIARV